MKDDKAKGVLTNRFLPEEEPWAFGKGQFEARRQNQ